MLIPRQRGRSKESPDSKEQGGRRKATVVRPSIE